MKISFIEDTPSSIRFKVSGISATFANSIRRILINSVSCFAIDKVTFYENTSAMFDEYMSHRIGLVPLATPASGYDEKDEILFNLEAEGPKTVYSKDLKSSDKKVKVVNEDIPIIKLAEGQKIRLEGKAVMRNGMKSAKFQPGLVTFKQYEEGNDFEFYIETFGQMTAKEILNRGLEIITQDLKSAHKEIKK
jgi:DNA-directed RNA polymerase subunit D